MTSAKKVTLYTLILVTHEPTISRQKISKPVELRIVFEGFESQGGVFGIGKLGKDKDDLIILDPPFSA